MRSGHASEMLRVAVVAPPYCEVPPGGYGGIEYVCWALVQGLLRRGHDVTLVSAGRNGTGARQIRTFEQPQEEGTCDDVGIELLHAARSSAALSEIQLDVVHDHTRAGPIASYGRVTPTVLTVHSAVSHNSWPYEYLSAPGAAVFPVAISQNQRDSAPLLPWHDTIHNGLDVGQFGFRAEKEPFVLYLGRFAPEKGVHLAIAAAKSAGYRLILAGIWTIPSEKEYFEREIRPKLSAEVQWVGELGPQEKAEMLGRARCLLFPVQWSEPFGLVVAEALACGTPVVCLRAGATEELVDDGVTGFLCDHPDELGGAIVAAGGLDPAACRRLAEASFSVDL